MVKRFILPGMNMWWWFKTFYFISVDQRKRTIGIPAWNKDTHQVANIPIWIISARVHSFLEGSPWINISGEINPMTKGIKPTDESPNKNAFCSCNDIIGFIYLNKLIRKLCGYRAHILKQWSFIVRSRIYSIRWCSIVYMFRNLL